MSIPNNIFNLHKERLSVAESVLEFKYNKTRVKNLTGVGNVKQNSNGVIYWMSREMRVQDNWSFLFAQKLALKNKIPLHVIFFFVPSFLNASPRQYKFMVQGLKEVFKECTELNVNFFIFPGLVYNHLPEIIKSNNIGAVICDFSPLIIFKKWMKELTKSFPENVPLCQVDGHNIVPCWEASPKQEYGARTIRTKILAKLNDYLTPFPPVIKHPHSGTLDITKNEFPTYEDVVLPDWIEPGYEAGFKMLHSFCEKRIKDFDDKRNDPLGMALSNLSPWLHFGQIAPQRCVIEVTKYKNKYRKGVDAFCEQIIIRRELSDNFCYYNDNYDNIEAAFQWAKDSLNKHRKDNREYIYTLEQFENAHTHDALWNAAQLELVKDGKMHGYMRMYWAKKILEWTEAPEKAIEIALYLNDHYSFDGRDPNGYVGVMWSICGIHDQGWPERAIFGKIRFMNYNGCARKFDVKKYIDHWGGKVFTTKNKTDVENPKVKKKKTKYN